MSLPVEDIILLLSQNGGRSTPDEVFVRGYGNTDVQVFFRIGGDLPSRELAVGLDDYKHRLVEFRATVVTFPFELVSAAREISIG